MNVVKKIHHIWLGGKAYSCSNVREPSLDEFDVSIDEELRGKTNCFINDEEVENNMKILQLIYLCAHKIRSLLWRKMSMPILLSMLSSHGKNVSIGKGADITLRNTSVGNHVYLAANTTIISTRAKVKIGSHVMFGPGVTILTGNHRYDIDLPPDPCASFRVS